MNRERYKCPHCNYTNDNTADLESHVSNCTRGAGPSNAPLLRGSAADVGNAQYEGPNDYVVQRIVGEKTYSVTRMTPTSCSPDYGLFLMDIGDKADYIIRQELKILKSLKFNLRVKVEFYTPANEDISQNFIFTEPAATVTATSDIRTLVNEVCATFEARLDEYTSQRSNWSVDRLIYCDVCIVRMTPARGLSYFPLPRRLRGKQAIINVKNKDNRCFEWAILCAIFCREHPNFRGHLNNVSRYRRMRNQLNFTDISFPVKLSDVPKFERINNLQVNVYGYENDFHILHLTADRTNRTNIIPLLLLSRGSRKHYCFIKDFDRLLSGQTKHKAKVYVCLFCLHSSTTEEKLERHVAYCTTGDQRQEMPEDLILQFKNVKNQMQTGLIFAADFECFLQPIEPNSLNRNADQQTSSSTLTHKHVINSFGCVSVRHCGCASEAEFEDLAIYRGEESVKHFLEHIFEKSTRYQQLLDTPKPFPTFSPHEWREFHRCTTCYICKQGYKKLCYSCCTCPKCFNERKTRDHCHACGLFRGVAHSRCNFLLRCQRDIPVVFHNLRRYDSHFVMQGIGTFCNEHKLKIDCVGKGLEDYLSFSLTIPHKLPNNKNITWKLKFIDSFLFLSTSLANLVQNLVGKDISGAANFRALLKFIPDDNLRSLLFRKGIYPYEAVQNSDIFDLPGLPPQSDFFSKLMDEGVSDEDYRHALDVYRVAGCSNFGEYHDLYLKCDVLQLADVFQNFRTSSYNGYGLDPAHYISLPSFAFDACLKMTKVQLELVSDPESYIFFESSIRGGVSIVTHRHAHASNPLVTPEANAGDDSEKPNNWIIYLDANNLYGWALSQVLPVGEFRFLDTNEIENVERNLMNYSSSRDYGFILEVDLEIPRELHDKLNEFPPAPEHLDISNEMLSEFSKSLLPVVNGEIVRHATHKLTPNLYPKLKYVTHYLNLQCYMKLGVLLKRVHRVMSFRQAAWISPFVSFNTEMRKSAKSDFEKDLYKLLTNSVFGKSMENIRAYRDIKLVTTEAALAKLVSSPRFKEFVCFENSLIAVSMAKEKVLLCKPIYTGFSCLDISKTLMFDFHYGYIKTTFGEKARLLLSDTDSFIYDIETENVYAEMKKQLHLFDTSNYPQEHPLFSVVNKKRLGIFKDETGGCPILDFVGLRAKLYSIRCADGVEVKKAKGVKKSVVAKHIRHQDYYEVLTQGGTLRHSMTRFQAKKHVVYTLEQTKVSVTCFDDKRFLLSPTGISTLAHGHFRILDGEVT